MNLSIETVKALRLALMALPLELRLALMALPLEGPWIGRVSAAIDALWDDIEAAERPTWASESVEDAACECCKREQRTMRGMVNVNVHTCEKKEPSDAC